MGDLVHHFTCCPAVLPLMPLTAGRHVAQASSSVLDPTGPPQDPHRPGDRLGPTSGGSIGSQGMGDLVHHFALCAAVPAIHCVMALWYGAL